jgi:transcriptional regulator of acetoin/glycerol metabolism
VVWQKVLQQIELVAASNATVLITGESGTGKELVARAIHLKSSRRKGAFTGANFIELPPRIVEQPASASDTNNATGPMLKPIAVSIAVVPFQSKRDVAQ